MYIYPNQTYSANLCICVLIDHFPTMNQLGQTRRASLDVGGKLVEDWDYNLQLDVVEEEGANLPPAIQLYRVQGTGNKHYFSLQARYPLSLYQVSLAW
jgi:hypothetical protein